MSTTVRLALAWRLLTLCLTAWVTLLVAATSVQAESDKPAVADSPPPSYPGLQEVVPRASKLSDELGQVATEIAGLVDLDSLTRQAAKQTRDWQDFSKQVESFGALESWPANRLLQAQTQLDQQNRDFGDMLSAVSEPLSGFEKIRATWTERRQFWRGWQSALAATGGKVPRDTFSRADAMIDKQLQHIGQIVDQLLALQQNISRDREGLLALREALSARLAELRSDPFERNAHPLLTREFFEQFDRGLEKKALEGISATLQFQGDFFNRQGWLLGLQAGLALLLFWLFRFLARVAAERAEAWSFVFERPVAAALFIATTIPPLFYVAAPSLLLLVMTTLAVFSAARLAAALIADSDERRYIYVLAVLYVLTGALTVTGLPLPYLRLYLTLLSLAGIPALLINIRRQAARKGRIDKVVLALSLGALVLMTVLTAELTGHVTLASTLLEAVFGTIFLLLLALMMLRIGEGGIEYLFTVRRLSGKQFVKQLGKRAPHRFKNLVRIIIAITAIHYLLEIWGLAEGFGNIWQTILGLEFSVGEFRLSLQMILLVILVLYLTRLTSWFIQAFMESQLFQQKRIDRGVRDAIKKLTHYALILIGFLVALSMAGIDLQNFTILAGAFGIGIGFGLQEIVNNFVSGLILLFERPVKVGDTVVVGDTWGIIKNIGMRSTVVETWDQSEIIVPNSQMISEKVTNWTLSSNVSRLVVPVGVKYGSDMPQVLSILEEVAKQHPEVVESPKPSAIFTAFGDSSLDFELRVWINDIMARYRVRSDLGVAIAAAFKQAGIEIPFPQRDLHLRSVEPGVLDRTQPSPDNGDTEPT